jgi:glycosidase
MRIAPTTSLHALTILGALASACGDTTVANNDYGTPPAGSAFNPGPGSGGGGYGTTGGQTTPAGGTLPVDPEPPAPAECPQELKRCAAVVTFPATTERAVELRGDWRGQESWDKGVAMERRGDTWRVEIPVPLDTRVHYKFCIDPTANAQCARWAVDPAHPSETDPGGNVNNVLAPLTCNEPTCEENPPVAEGVFDWRDSIIYFIFVDRFFDSDGRKCASDGASGPIGSYLGGDFKGIEAKIPYLKRLGINTVWLTNPAENTAKAETCIFQSSRKCMGFHGYWPEDLDKTESCFGASEFSPAKAEADLKSLVGALHAAGIKVLLDYAMVHVHSDATVFRTKPDWFWRNTPEESGGRACSENNSWDHPVFGKRCWFDTFLPHFNYTRNDALEYSIANALSWVTKAAPAGDAIDGLRLDAIKHIEDRWLTTLRSRVQDAFVKGKPQGTRFYMVGETFNYDPGTLRSYVDPRTKLDGQFDFKFRLEVMKSLFKNQGGGFSVRLSDFARFLDANDRFYTADTIMSPFIGNHDIGRVVHMAGDRSEWNEFSSGDQSRAWANLDGADLLGQPNVRAPYERLAVAYSILFSSRGAPLLYYGDEVGLAGAGDPDNRRPMPFCAAANMQNARAIGRVCNASDGDPAWNSHQAWLFDRVSKLTALRSEHPAMRRGRRTTLSSSDDTWAYALETSGDTVYVAVNRSDSARSVSGLPSGNLVDLISGATVAGGTLELGPREARLFRR